MITKSPGDTPPGLRVFKDGKRLKSHRERTNIIRLDEDVAEKFPNSEKVNEALRYLIKHPPAA